MLKYIVLALLLALGVLLYVKRDEVMSVFRGEKSATAEIQETMEEMKSRARGMKDAMMGEKDAAMMGEDDVEIDEVEVSQ